MSIPFGRGQTEPLAALVAVSMLAIGISLFAGYYTQTLPGTTDRTVEEPTTDQIWTELQNGGVYEPGSLSDLVEDDDDKAILPQGWVVYVNVTWRQDDATQTRDEIAYDKQGEADSDIVDYLNDNPRPEEAGYESRPVPVKTGPGEVRGGRLHVVVWQ